VSGPLGFEPEELLLIKQYGRIRLRAERAHAEVHEHEDLGLGADGGARQIVELAGADAVIATWLDSHTALAMTDRFAARVHVLQDQLVTALTSLPVMPKGKLGDEDAAALNAVYRPVQKAVSLFARYVYAVQALRSVIANETSEEDSTPVDAYAIGGTILKLDAYRNYDRIRVKLTRRSPKAKKKIAAYNARPENVARRAAYVRAKRKVDPEYRARENARRREKYAEKKKFAVVVATMLSAIEQDQAGTQAGVTP
jgi:hypothetical protein